MREHLDITRDYRMAKKYALARYGNVDSLPMLCLGCATNGGMAAWGKAWAAHSAFQPSLP